MDGALTVDMGVLYGFSKPMRKLKTRMQGCFRCICSSFCVAWLMFCMMNMQALLAQTAEQALDDFFRAYLDEYFRMRPTDATQAGDHRFDAQLDDLSTEARAKWVELQRRTLAALPQKVDYSRLSREKQVDYEIFKHHLETSLWLNENFRPFEDDPRVYNEYINDSVYLVLAQSSLPKPVNIRNATERIRQIPRVIATARATLRRPPRVHTETAIKQNRGAIAFYEKDIFDLAGRSPELAGLRDAAREVVPALKDYQNWLEHDLLPRADGEWRLGREKFARKFELVLDIGMSADELLAEAEAEFARVERDMYVLARQLWSRYYPGRVIPPDDADGRRQTIQLVLQKIALQHSTPESLVKDARTTVAGIKKFITEAGILGLPVPDRCRIIEMPEFQRGNALAYMNSPPPLDSTGAGFYAISPPPKDWPQSRVRSLLEEYNRYMLQILTIHEAYPGHYVQHEYANRNPSRIRKVLGSGVYIEGWAVYTEQMMLDQGYGQGDAALRLTQLKFFLRAVANTILDYKMHCTAMTDEEALQFLVERAFQSEGEARLKIIRAKQSSTQLSTYFAGRTAHYRLRQKLQRELGEKFVLSRYHEAVLSCGPVPVKYLPELVQTRLK